MINFSYYRKINKIKYNFLFFKVAIFNFLVDYQSIIVDKLIFCDFLIGNNRFLLVITD
jgi:hypothetical protein